MKSYAHIRKFTLTFIEASWVTDPNNPSQMSSVGEQLNKTGIFIPWNATHPPNKENNHSYTKIE